MSKKIIRGTVAELVAMKLTINGVKMDQGTISTITRLGLARASGEGAKIKAGARGKAPTIWELDSTINMNLAVVAPGELMAV